MKSEFQKILIVRLGAIGDVIRTLPALRALRDNLPQAYIAWMVEDRAASLLIDHPDLNKVFVLPRKKWQNNFWRVSSWKEILGFIEVLKQEKFDLVLDFHGLFKSGLISFLSGVKHRVGYSRKFSKEGNFLFNNDLVSLPGHKVNRVEKNLLLIKHLGLILNNFDPIIPIGERDREFVSANIFSRLPVTDGLKVIIHPGSSPGTPYKRWHFTRFARLADQIAKKYEANILFTAGNDETELVKKIMQQMDTSSAFLCPTKTLPQLAETIRQCDLFIGNDTAPMHLAAFVGTPVIALFGPTDPIENSPWGKGKIMVIRKDVSCNPCRNRKCPNLFCMDAITVEEVMNAVEEIFSQRG